MTIKRVGPLSCAKIVGAVYAVLGVLIGACVSLFAMLGMMVSNGRQPIPDNPLTPFIGAIMGVGAIVLFPVFYGAIGFLFALISAWFYNLLASKIGGIEIDIA